MRHILQLNSSDLGESLVPCHITQQSDKKLSKNQRGMKMLNPALLLRENTNQIRLQINCNRDAFQGT